MALPLPLSLPHSDRNEPDHPRGDPGRPAPRSPELSQMWEPPSPHHALAPPLVVFRRLVIMTTRIKRNKVKSQILENIPR